MGEASNAGLVGQLAFDATSIRAWQRYRVIR